MPSSGGDVDKVLIKEDIKGYVRHWDKHSVSMVLSEILDFERWTKQDKGNRWESRDNIES